MSRACWLIFLLAACGGSPAAPSAPAPVAAGPRTVDVVIDGAGYTPARVEATPGERLTLRFERLDEFNCGEVVVFPSTGKRVDVPVGKKVAVDVEAPASGELAFTCGMAMYEGALVVSGG